MGEKTIRGREPLESKVLLFVGCRGNPAFGVRCKNELYLVLFSKTRPEIPHPIFLIIILIFLEV